VEDCAMELKQILDVDWLFQPFSRCLECNRVLVPLTTLEAYSIPEKILNYDSSFWLCKTCDKVYWYGSHTKRMLATLKRWNS
jgi:uncharacterized protein with PIN domain